jgi:uncharacterized membrane protein
MPRLDNSIDIKLPKERVFEYVSNVTHRPEWVKWTKRAEVTSTEPGVIGSTDAGLMQVGPQKQTVEAIVTEYRPDYVFTRRHTRGMEMTDRIAVVPSPSGEGTKVAWSVEYTPPMGQMGKMMDMLFMERLFDQLMKDSLNILRDKLETAR